MTTHETYDVVILGSGPAGLQAGIHAARKNVRTLMLGRMDNSSLYWAHIENYCCQFKVSGEEVLNTGREQVEAFGGEFRDEDVLSIDPEGSLFSIRLESGDTVLSKTVILATGSSRNKLGVPGEKELLGKGVSYCVDCDAGFYRGQIVAVAGSRSAAAGGAVALTRFASEVHLYCDKLDVADGLRRQLDETGVVLHEGVQITEIRGETGVDAVALDDTTTRAVSGVFIELGAKGVLELTATLGVTLDESMKYIDTDKKQRTNIPGIFAAGDICGPPLQMAKAVGEGCVAGIEAANYAKKLTHGS
ncbi:MAG: FAD-dependent oxidoreductase [Pseudodesulfovibrio sp.]|uniref:FAD-dependent pyridine nucleotide-disulfide oxidoreductase n=1 Tax=Pseudodesulfovibrio aespoeensis (strain ATCC 700646 / DSM 10631 / Aspo-2) TaxID=643562 RepID=E6VVB3_PSEA9|nr:MULTISPECIES: FAD-dependent oxidoreductase [Pseudodesulfovibrio]MBU4193218.1 FAD-dependent oxidoreductase [Pseudomonadota bacterium]ADU62357.1 FAD-dependent pyridine nucleotide-disulfide oxidoreductase [Pseudodesulfovibrio aespoeensis Aspo-2]MBU4243152.1 FAD-dependent oxidoreductase [Pseudomonadota bacterium]MBU4377691.1 FAD-dependent oxidoreductase [Pseudomonadota bacterium]MBU4473979.1 FAD-dependent oxidoreductase [Pseudomonadota bacterium]